MDRLILPPNTTVDGCCGNDGGVRGNVDRGSTLCSSAFTMIFAKVYPLLLIVSSFKCHDVTVVTNLSAV